ncbi:unnamed protein product [Absidia cylindrospora]
MKRTMKKNQKTTKPSHMRNSYLKLPIYKMIWDDFIIVSWIPIMYLLIMAMRQQQQQQPMANGWMKQSR